MAASSADSKNKDPTIDLWISENDDSEEDPEIVEDGLPPGLREFIKKIVAKHKPPSAKKTRGKGKLQSKPRWRNTESQANLRDYKETVLAELRLDASDEEEVDEDDTPDWTHNFKTFTAKPLPFTGTTGPRTNSTDPLTLFTSVWDKNIMSLIAEESNRYAKQMAELQQNEEIPENYTLVKWKDATVEELYIMFALTIFASIRSSNDFRSDCRALRIPDFTEITELERFVALCRCMHFVDNTKLAEKDKMIAKIKPIMDHCNTKFAAMYQPRQFLDVDDSLLLSKDGSENCIRLQANYFGVRTYELAEVFTGYVLKILQYTGSDKKFTYKDKAQIVLDMVNEYSGKGHRIVTNTYFSSVHLARILKSKGFDNIGEVNKGRKDLPEIIQQLERHENDPELYQLNGNKVRVVSRHCGDLSIVAWSEWDITAISTYHTSEMRTSKHGVRRPALTLDYTKVREKISDKDKDLIQYIMMREPSERWYLRQFRRLFNISLRNIYVIYKFNMRNKVCLSQAAFRHKLAYQLLDLYADKNKVMKARYKAIRDCDSDDEDDDDDSWTDLDSDDSSSSDCCIM